MGYLQSGIHTRKKLHLNFQITYQSASNSLKCVNSVSHSWCVFWTLSWICKPVELSTSQLVLFQDGKLNAPIRKGLKTSQKFYCCPIEGCPRGPNRPFSQFSLVKQVFLFPDVFSHWFSPVSAPERVHFCIQIGASLSMQAEVRELYAATPSACDSWICMFACWY